MAIDRIFKQKALRKIAKHSLKLARHRARFYAEGVQEESHDCQSSDHFRYHQAG